MPSSNGKNNKILTFHSPLLRMIEADDLSTASIANSHDSRRPSTVSSVQYLSVVRWLTKVRPLWLSWKRTLISYLQKVLKNHFSTPYKTFDFQYVAHAFIWSWLLTYLGSGNHYILKFCELGSNPAQIPSGFKSQWRVMTKYMYLGVYVQDRLSLAKKLGLRQNLRCSRPNSFALPKKW